jgi:hypothetical protein
MRAPVGTGGRSCDLGRDPATRGLLAAAVLRGELWLIGLGLVGAIQLVTHYL